MADLTISINEKVIIDGNDRGVYTSQTIPNITGIDNRILTCPTGSVTTLFGINPSPSSSGTFLTGSIQYARVTNKSPNLIQLLVSLETQDIWFTINTGSSFMVSTNASSSNSVDFILPNISSVGVEPSGSSSIVEYFVATS
jgi:hypothetical protein